MTYFQNMKRHLDQELIIIKTKAISSDTARHRKPKFNKISWIKENVKTVGVHHGYNVDNYQIWKDIIDRMKIVYKFGKAENFITKVKL